MTFLGGLTLIFITLKLIGYITFSWWLVFAPLYPGVLIWLLLIVGAIAVGSQGYTKSGRRRPF